MQICDNRIGLAADLRDEASSSKLEVDSFKSATSMQEIRGIATISGTHGGTGHCKIFSNRFSLKTKTFSEKEQREFSSKKIKGTAKVKGKARHFSDTALP